MMNSIIFSSLFQKNETKKKPSLFIDLPKDLVPLGLIDFCLRLGFESNELDFDLFQPVNQSYTMKFLQHTSTFISEEESTWIIYYESESALSTLLSAIASEDMVETKTDSPLTYYENLSHLWSAYGTGEKDEAHPQQHVSVKMDIQEELKTNALLKEVCYLALRLGLYATSISLPAITTKERHVTISFKHENESYMELTAKNAIQICGRKESLPAVVHSVATAKHVSEGGLLGVWELNEKQVNEAAILMEEKWSDESEASYIIKALEKEPDRALEAEIYMTATKKTVINSS